MLDLDFNSQNDKPIFFYPNFVYPNSLLDQKKII